MFYGRLRQASTAPAAKLAERAERRAATRRHGGELENPEQYSRRTSGARATTTPRSVAAVTPPSPHATGVPNRAQHRAPGIALRQRHCCRGRARRASSAPGVPKGGRRMLGVSSGCRDALIIECRPAVRRRADQRRSQLAVWKGGSGWLSGHQPPYCRARMILDISQEIHKLL